jgi:hypothetical protein
MRLTGDGAADVASGVVPPMGLRCLTILQTPAICLALRLSSSLIIFLLW